MSGVVVQILKTSDEVKVDVTRMAKLILRNPMLVQSSTGRPRVDNVLRELCECDVTYRHPQHASRQYHGLYGSTSCCISQWPSQWGWANFDPPQLRNRLTDFDEIRNLEISSEDHPPCKISFRSDDVGGVGEHPVCHC